MPSEAKEALIADQIVATLVGIGPVGASWLTDPYDAVIGAPGDAMGLLDRPRLFVQHAGTVPRTEANASPSAHALRSVFTIVIASMSHRTVLNTKADIARAIRAAEGTFTASFQQPLWEGDFAHSDAMLSSGIYLGILSVFIDYESDHTNV